MPLSMFATQMLAPLKANTCGTAARGKFPELTPSPGRLGRPTSTNRGAEPSRSHRLSARRYSAGGLPACVCGALVPPGLIYFSSRLNCSPDPGLIRLRLQAAHPARRTSAHTQIAQLRATPVKNIFVGNLDFNTSEEDVRQLFAAYGWVDRVTIVRDRDTDQPRGFGFVEMASAEDGKRAIAALNGTLLGDRALNVNEARPRPERAGGGRKGRERRRSGERW